MPIPEDCGMLNRAAATPNTQIASERADAAAQLLESLREGVEALRDSEVEAKVHHYFEAHPAYSRDLIHVAAVATRFQSEKARTAAPISKPSRMLPPLT